MDLSASLDTLPGIGPARAAKLADAGYDCVGDLLAHLPHRYEDRTRVRSVAEALELFTSGDDPVAVTLRGRLETVRRVPIRRRGMSLVRGRLRDASGEVEVLWFNRPYLAGSIDPETEYLLHGPLRRRKGASDGAAPHLLNPSCEPAERALHGGRIVPVYPAAGPLGPAFVRRLLGNALEGLDFDAVPEPLPRHLLERHRLPRLGPALRALHLPADDADADALDRRTGPAHRRLVYGELLEQQLVLAVLRRQRSGVEKAHRYSGRERARRVAREILPFRLTDGQRGSLAEIADDLLRPRPMARLLQGDVGSGKTIVAVLALVLALESGLQGAFLAPTELLAEQHFRRLRGLLGERYRLGLFTGSNERLPELRRELARGRVDLAVGTHALLQEGVRFRRLALAVIDEQHRFGVVQRRVLEAKGVRPDVLVMTATPIPRTLALTAFGDLDLSVLGGLPPGRRPVETEVRPAAERETVYDELSERLAGPAGDARAYVVFPRIEGEEGDGVPSLAVEGESVRRRLEERLGPTSVAVVHGRMPAPERERAMAAFAGGGVRALLATTVIEVGVDVPEAAAMVIEGAERFGLSQLHQLRGRVGRGEEAGRCVALVGCGEEALTEEARARLKAFAATVDGFEIAERDLEIRGFGDLLGTRQAGLARFRVADPVAHREVLEAARRDAAEVVARLGEPGLQVLRRRVERALERRTRLLSSPLVQRFGEVRACSDA